MRRWSPAHSNRPWGAAGERICLRSRRRIRRPSGGSGTPRRRGGAHHRVQAAERPGTEGEAGRREGRAAVEAEVKAERDRRGGSQGRRSSGAAGGGGREGGAAVEAEGRPEQEEKTGSDGPHSSVTCAATCAATSSRLSGGTWEIQYAFSARSANNVSWSCAIRASFSALMAATGAAAAAATTTTTTRW